MASLRTHPVTLSTGEVTGATMKPSIAVPALTLLLAGCAMSPVTATTARQPQATAAATTADAAMTAETQVLVKACSAARGVATQVYALHTLPPLTALNQMGADGPAWSTELRAGEAPTHDGVPSGRNPANEAMVSLAEAVLALGFGNLSYDDGQQAQAAKDYTRFDKILGRMIRMYC